jgi:hypothetical protein
LGSVLPLLEDHAFDIGASEVQPEMT